MNELQRNQEQLHRSFYGEAWHGEAILELLNGVTTSVAAARPIPQAHSIWEIVLHIAFWFDTVRARLDGNPVSQPEPGEDWQTITSSTDDGWKTALVDLSRSFKQLEEALGEMTAEEFLREFPGKDFNAEFLVQGIIQHTAYHGGQIGMLKKALLQG